MWILAKIEKIVLGNLSDAGRIKYLALSSEPVALRKDCAKSSPNLNFIRHNKFRLPISVVIKFNPKNGTKFGSPNFSSIELGACPIIKSIIPIPRFYIFLE